MFSGQSKLRVQQATLLYQHHLLSPCQLTHRLCSSDLDPLLCSARLMACLRSAVMGPAFRRPLLPLLPLLLAALPPSPSLPLGGISAANCSARA